MLQGQASHQCSASSQGTCINRSFLAAKNATRVRGQGVIAVQGKDLQCSAQVSYCPLPVIDLSHRHRSIHA